MTAKETIKRYILLIISTFFIALGIALTRYSELGVTTISSVPNVLSLKFKFLSIGSWLNLWNLTLIAGQLAILRRDFKIKELLQILVAFLLGYFTDICTMFVVLIPIHNYLTRLITVLAGVVILGIGVSLSFIANVLLNPGEAFVRVLAKKLNKNIGNVKIAFDMLCVLSAAILSLIFFDFKLVGVREGTIIAVFLTGTIVKILNRRIAEPLNKFLSA